MRFSNKLYLIIVLSLALNATQIFAAQTIFVNKGNTASQALKADFAMNPQTGDLVVTWTEFVNSPTSVRSHARVILKATFLKWGKNGRYIRKKTWDLKSAPTGGIAENHEMTSKIVWIPGNEEFLVVWTYAPPPEETDDAVIRSVAFDSVMEARVLKKKNGKPKGKVFTLLEALDTAFSNAFLGLTSPTGSPTKLTGSPTKLYYNTVGVRISGGETTSNQTANSCTLNDNYKIDGGSCDDIGSCSESECEDTGVSGARLIIIDNETCELAILRIQRAEKGLDIWAVLKKNGVEVDRKKVGQVLPTDNLAQPRVPVRIEGEADRSVTVTYPTTYASNTFVTSRVKMGPDCENIIIQKGWFWIPPSTAFPDVQANIFFSAPFPPPSEGSDMSSPKQEIVGAIFAEHEEGWVMARNVTSKSKIKKPVKVFPLGSDTNMIYLDLKYISSNSPAASLKTSGEIPNVVALWMNKINFSFKEIYIQTFYRE